MSQCRGQNCRLADKWDVIETVNNDKSSIFRLNLQCTERCTNAMIVINYKSRFIYLVQLFRAITVKGESRAQLVFHT